MKEFGWNKEDLNQLTVQEARILGKIIYDDYKSQERKMRSQDRKLRRRR
jgi:hypothetical protein